MDFSNDKLKAIGIGGLLAIAIWAFVSGWVYTGSQYKDVQSQVVQMREERDKWMKLALEGTRLAEVSAVRTGRFTATNVFPSESENVNLQEVAKKLDSISNAVEPGIERVPASDKIK